MASHGVSGWGWQGWSRFVVERCVRDRLGLAGLAGLCVFRLGKAVPVAAWHGTAGRVRRFGVWQVQSCLVSVRQGGQRGVWRGAFRLGGKRQGSFGAVMHGHARRVGVWRGLSWQACTGHIEWPVFSCAVVFGNGHSVDRRFSFGVTLLRQGD